MAQPSDDLHIVTYEQHRASVMGDLRHLTEAPFLELCISDSEHLVDYQDLWLQVRSYCERESHVHSARIPFHGRVDVLLDARECNDLSNFLETSARFIPSIAPLR